MIPVIQIGSLQLPTYFLIISLSLSALLYLLSYRVNQFQKDRRTAFDISLLLMISGFVGARLLHIFYEEWDYYKADPKLIFYFWNGGFVFLGGLIFCLITGFIYSRFKKISFFEWADFFTPLFSLGHAFGRVGCFLSGCCYGSECELPWAYSGRHPTALYLSLGELIIFLFLLMMEKKKVYKFSGGLFMMWLLIHSLLRFYVEYYRNDFRGIFINFGVLGHLSISQVISLIIILLCTIFFIQKYVEQKCVEKEYGE